MHRRIFRWLAVLATAAMVAGTGAAAASAAPVIVPKAVHVAKDGTAGIEALHGNSVRNIGATLTTSSPALNIGGVGTGGLGDQLCDPNTGFGLQLGLTSNGSSFTVEYAAGILPGAAQFVCEGNGVLQSPHVMNANLTGIAVGDEVKLFTSFRNYRLGHRHHHYWRGRATFQAFDSTTGAGPYTARVWTKADWDLSSAGAGVQQNTTLTSACTPVANPVFVPPILSSTPNGPDGSAYNTGFPLFLPVGSGACNELADFYNVFTNGPFGIFGSGRGLTETGQWNEVYTSGGGLKANAAIVATNDTLYPAVPFSSSPSEFDVYAGQVVG